MKCLTFLLLLIASVSSANLSKGNDLFVECKGQTLSGTTVSATLCLLEVTTNEELREFEIIPCGDGPMGIFLTRLRPSRAPNGYEYKFLNADSFSLSAEGTDDAFTVVASEINSANNSTLVHIEMLLDPLFNFMSIKAGHGWNFTFRKASCEIV